MTNVMFYSKHGNASMKLYQMMKDANLIPMTYIQADNNDIRSRLLSNDIKQLPAIYLYDDNNSNILIGKECYLFFDELLTEKIAREKNEQQLNENKSDRNLPIKKPSYLTNINDSHEYPSEIVSSQKVGKNMGMNKTASERQKQDTYKEMFEDNVRTIKNEETYSVSSRDSKSLYPPPSQSLPPPQQSMIIDDDFGSPPPNIPSPIKQPSQNFDLDEDPSGMGLKSNGNPVSIAKMLEDSRSSLKIQKFD